MNWLLWTVSIAGPSIGATLGYFFGWWATKGRAEDAEESARRLREELAKVLTDHAILAAENALLRKKAGEKP